MTKSLFYISDLFDKMKVFFWGEYGFIYHFVVTYKNNSSEKQKCVFLGSNHFLGKENFGNSSEIEIFSDTSKSYEFIFNNFIGSGKEIVSGIKIQSTEQDIKQRMIIHGYELDGRGWSAPLDLLKLFDPKQISKNIVESKTFKLTIDGNTFIGFELSAHSYLKFTFYKKIKFQSGLKKYLNKIFKSYDKRFIYSPSELFGGE